VKRLSLLLVNVASVISLLAGTLLLKLRLRREPDAWRRTVGIGLRSEASKFALSAFGLDALSDCLSKDLSQAAEEQHFVERFARFLQTQPNAQFALKHDRYCSYRVANPHVDVILAQFSPGGELLSISPFLDDRSPLALAQSYRLEIEDTLVEEYNQTRHLAENIRPVALLRNLNKRWLRVESSQPFRQLIANYRERMMKGCCVSFEAVALDPRKRFDPPDFRLRRIIGLGFLNLVCRRLPSRTVDVWMQVHHTGADGVPMQDLLTQLENSWGIGDRVLFLADSAAQPDPRPCYSPPHERPVHLLIDFVDFTPLIMLRKQLKKRFAAEGAENIPLGCLFLWCLADQPEFAGVKFATTVDVPANKGHARAVDLVPVRPADYKNTGRHQFAIFVRDFNRLIVDARDRRTVSYEAMRRLALLPPFLASAALKLNPAGARSTFGTVGVSIVRDAKVIVAPMADRGFDGGFIALGSMSLPCSGGSSTAAISVKGAHEAIKLYPIAIRRAIRTCETRFGQSDWP
jgi:hypothetical protein